MKIVIKATAGSSYNEIVGSESHPEPVGTVRCTKDFQANLDLGFALCAREREIRQEIAQGGRELLKGLIGALIAQGVDHIVSLSQEISRLGGDHLYIPVQDLICEFEGENPEHHLWHKNAPGHYVLTA